MSADGVLRISVCCPWCQAGLNFHYDFNRRCCRGRHARGLPEQAWLTKIERLREKHADGAADELLQDVQFFNKFLKVKHLGTVKAKTIAGSHTGQAIVDLSGYEPSYVLAVIPGAGNASTVFVSYTSGAAANPDAAHWFEWPPSAVGAQRSIEYGSRLQAVKFVRVSGTSADKYEVCV